MNLLDVVPPDCPLPSPAASIRQGKRGNHDRDAAQELSHLISFPAPLINSRSFARTTLGGALLFPQRSTGNELSSKRVLQKIKALVFFLVEKQTNKKAKGWWVIGR